MSSYYNLIDIMLALSHLNYINNIKAETCDAYYFLFEYVCKDINIKSSSLAKGGSGNI